MIECFRLGATMYVPAVHPDLAQIVRGEKLTGLRSMAVCTEDSIAEAQLPEALLKLESALATDWITGAYRFVRPRNVDVLRRIVDLDGVEKIDGFVLPKVTRSSLPDYLAAIEGLPKAKVMVTLETADVFDPTEMMRLRDLMSEERYFARILALRIGGNDLMNLLGLRRPKDRTIYETPLGPVISHLVTTFRPHGFHLTAPVFEYLSGDDLLQREVREDIAHGLSCKTAIHPRQIPLIEELYRADAADLEVAKQVLRAGAPATFRAQDSMCEVATHSAWAAATLARAEVYGVLESVSA